MAASRNKSKKPPTAQLGPRSQRRLTLEKVERLATISMAFLGFVSFAWQIREQVSNKVEVIAVETGEPDLTSDGAIRIPLNVINHSDRTVYIRSVILYSATSYSASPDSSLSFDPDSTIRIEPGSIAQFSASPVPILRALALSQATNSAVQVKTTRKIHHYPVKFHFPAVVLNTISVAAGSAPATRVLNTHTASALRARITAECRTLVAPVADSIGVWRTPTGEIWFGGHPVEGGLQATEFICAGIAAAALDDSIKRRVSRDQ